LVANGHDIKLKSHNEERSAVNRNEQSSKDGKRTITVEGKSWQEIKTMAEAEIAKGPPVKHYYSKVQSAFGKMFRGAKGAAASCGTFMARSYFPGN